MPMLTTIVMTGGERLLIGWWNGVKEDVCKQLTKSFNFTSESVCQLAVRDLQQDL